MHKSWSADGRFFAWSDAQMIRVWDTATAESAGPALPLPSTNALTFSPDNTLLAVSRYLHEANTGTVSAWDFRTGKELVAFNYCNGEEVKSLSFSPDGRRLATAGSDKRVMVWDLDSGRELLTFRGHRNQVTCVAFSPDGTRLASGCRNGEVRVWNVGPPARDAE
jgi:WD40 repeat protein